MKLFISRPFGLTLTTLALLSVPVAARAQNASALTNQPPHSLTAIRFRFIADGPVRGGFGLIDNRLVFGTESGTVYGLDARSGRMLWRRRAGSPVLSTPAVYGGRAYLTTWDNALHAIDAATGREVWRADLGRTLGSTDYWEYYVSSPVLSGGRLYVGSGSGRAFALDLRSGRIVWSSSVGARVRTTPLVLADKVIVGTMSGHVIALDRDNGRQLWKFASEGATHEFAFKKNDTRSVVTQPILVGETVIAGGRDGNIYGIDSNSGVERWRETHDGGSWILGLAGDLDRFYSGSGSAFIVQAADASSGKERWRLSTGAAMFGGIVKAGDVLVSNGIYGSLYGIDANGKELWRLGLPDMSFASPLVARGVVYTGSDDGSVVAVDTSTSAPAVLEPHIYTFTNQPEGGFFWFKPEIVASLKAQFAAAGYDSAGTTDLSGLLKSPIGNRGRKLIVLADTRLPADVDGGLLRAFVDGGGILVVLGVNPLAFTFDRDGAPAGDDEERAAAAFGMTAPNLEQDNGYNVSSFTVAAHSLGLRGPVVGFRWARPDEISVPLALDRSGMASAWVKRFHKGGMMISLPVPRTRPRDITPLINAINLIAQRSNRGML